MADYWVRFRYSARCRDWHLADHICPSKAEAKRHVKRLTKRHGPQIVVEITKSEA
jgi:hypothetical protein